MNYKYWVIGAIVIVLVGGGIYWYVSSSTPPTFQTASVGTGNVVASVDVPVNVMAENSVDLSFEEGGQIASVNVQEGQTVGAGTVLTSLDASSLLAGLEEASGSLAAAQANLAQLQAGTRPEQLQINEGAVTTSQASLSAALGSAYTAADDAIQNQTDNFFTNPNSNNPTFNVPDTDTQAVINIASTRITIGQELQTWFAANASSSDASTITSLANQTLSDISSYLDTVAVAVNNATPNSTVTATVLAGYKVNVVTARNEVAAAINAVTGAESALTTAQNQLNLAQAGATPQQIEAQQAVVLQAQAAVASAQVAVNHASIVAPFGGTVRNVTAKIGLVVTPGVPVLSLTNNNGLKIEGYVAENDVAEIAVNDPVNVTLDAFGTGTVFPATVATIDSDVTTVNGTPSYEVTMYFTNPDPRIKDGMTGNVSIVTGEHDNVIEVPTRLLINSGNSQFVLVEQNGQSVQTPVTTGLTGDNGMTEITSGLTVGETLANF